MKYVECELDSKALRLARACGMSSQLIDKVYKFKVKDTEEPSSTFTGRRKIKLRRRPQL